MAQVLVDDASLTAIAGAIREKLDVETTYLPSQMAGAIESIPTGGTDLTSADAGKVVVESGGEYVLAAQTSRNISQDGTYDTTTNNQVVVSVSGGGGGGSANILSGYAEPSGSVGENGSIYLLLTHNMVPEGATTNLIAGQTVNNYPPRNAFDGNDSTFWTTADRNYNNMYIGYDNVTPIAVNAVGICPRAYNGNVQIGDFKVQASNDLETWVDIYSDTISNEPATYGGVWTRLEFQNSTKYRAWRILALTLNGSQTFTLFGLQFYADELEVIEGAYLKVGGSWSPLIGNDIDDVNLGS